jgi:hypothetical protein
MAGGSSRYLRRFPLAGVATSWGELEFYLAVRDGSRKKRR